MTISFWGTQPTTNWRNYLTLRTGSTGEEFQFQRANNGLIVYKSNNKNQNAINMVGSSSLDLGSDWHHFVVTVDSAAQKAYMYVDGELINEKEWTHAEQITNLTFNGAWNFGGRGSDANLDEVQIYDQAMTAEQVKYLYNNPSLYHAAVYQRNVSGSGNWSDALWDANGLTGQAFANSSAVKLTASNSPTLTLDQAVTVNSLDFNGSMTIGGTNTLTFNGEKRITVANAADTVTISTPINALYDNGLTKTGAGTLTLNNNQSTFTGNVVVNGGTLVASKSWKYVDTTVFGDYVSKTVTVNDGAELVFAAQDVVSNSGTNSPIRFIANGGTIRNSGTVYNNLANTVFTDGAQLYAADGNATWKAYKLSSKVSVLRNADGSAADAVTFSSDLTKANATYSFGNGTSIYVEDITSSSAAAADANADLIISALVTNPNQESNGTFHKDGAGILEFTAANTFNGTASIREGVLRLSGNGALGTSTVTLGDKGTLEVNVGDGEEKSFANNITGAGALTKTGNGKLTLTGTNTYTGKTTISAGTLALSGDAYSNVYALTMDNAGRFEMKSDGTVKLSSLNGAGEVLLSASNTVLELGVGTQAGDSAVFSGHIISSANQKNLTLKKVGAGTQTLNRAGYLYAHLGNSYKEVIVDEGRLIVDAVNSVYTANRTEGFFRAPIIVNEGGTLEYVQMWTTSPNIDLTLNGGTLQLDNAQYLNKLNFNSGTVTRGGDTWNPLRAGYVGSGVWNVTGGNSVIENDVEIVKNGDHTTFTLNIADSASLEMKRNLVGLSSHPGSAVNVTGTGTDGTGLLKLYSGSGLPKVAGLGTVTFNNADVQINGGMETWSGDGFFASDVVLTDADLNVNADAGKTVKLDRKISGNGTLTKTGAGTLKLNTANGFNVSSLNVSEGRANVVGTMTGDLAIADGASFSPGDGIGTLTVNGLFSADDGGRLVFELGADASDLLILGSGSTLDIADDAVIELLFADADPDKAYTLIQAEDGLGEYTDSAFWTNLLTAASDANWDLSVVGNTIQAIAGSGTIDPSDPSVPEPAAWALFVLGAAGLFIVRKKRV